MGSAPNWLRLIAAKSAVGIAAMAALPRLAIWPLESTWI